MQLRQWFQPPRRLLVLFFGAALVPTVALGWLGWRLLDQDRALERQRIQERLEHAADLVGAQLRQAFSEVEEQLAVLAALPSSELAPEAARRSEILAQNALLVVFHTGDI